MQVLELFVPAHRIMRARFLRLELDFIGYIDSFQV